MICIIIYFCGSMKEDRLRLRFIINPHSGVNSKNLILDSIPMFIDGSKFQYEICFTEYAGHAEELARQAVESMADAVVAVGGDGTVNEVARALIHTSTIFGIIPCGSGNGLARHLHIPTDVKKAIEIINAYQVKSIDYGKINGHPFFCTCGVGFDAYISSRFAQSQKRGSKAYVENVLKSFHSYKPEAYEIETESDSFACQAFLITCANASQYGNNAYIAPHASLCDGMMDVAIIEPFDIPEAIPLTIQLFTKHIDDNKHVRRLRCKKLHIHRTAPGCIHVDGDPVYADEDLCIEIIPDGLRVLKDKY